MKKELPERKKIRLDGYDYSQTGYYWITICVENRHEIFAQIVGAGFSRPQDNIKIQLSPYGETVEKYIEELPVKYPNIKIEKYIIMPNHIHMILNISHTNVVHGRENPAPTTVSSMMGWFKYQTTKEINNLNGGEIEKIWQRSFHEEIIRNEKTYCNKWQYIENNPAKWAEDDYFIKK